MRMTSYVKKYLKVADVQEGPIILHIADVKEGFYDKPDTYDRRSSLLLDVRFPHRQSRPALATLGSVLLVEDQLPGGVSAVVGYWAEDLLI